MKYKAPSVRAVSETWNHRSALRLSNGSIEIVVLRGGGHIAELRLAAAGDESMNCLWSAPWPTADSGTARHTALAHAYGGGPAGHFLAGYTGHALCLDIFGPPPIAEAALGVPLHGEAGARPWTFEFTERGCIGRVSLPIARLRFQREISLASKSALLFVAEQVENHGKSAREVHWVQHVSLGPPFLTSSGGAVHASLDRAMAWPHFYHPHELLKPNAEFHWPLAPSEEHGTLDLQTPFWRRGFGFVVAARVDINSDYGFVAALNAPLGLALVYCFRRHDFPWVEVWEENSARAAPPWNSRAQVRGMEFGTTPVPLGREGIRNLGNLLGTPGSRILAPDSLLRAHYLVCIARVPTTWNAITEVVPAPRSLKIVGPTPSDVVSIRAEGIGAFLKGSTAA